MIRIIAAEMRVCWTSYCIIAWYQDIFFSFILFGEEEKVTRPTSGVRISKMPQPESRLEPGPSRSDDQTRSKSEKSPLFICFELLSNQNICFQGISYDHIELKYYVNGKSLDTAITGIRGTVYPALYGKLRSFYSAGPSFWSWNFIHQKKFRLFCPFITSFWQMLL